MVLAPFSVPVFGDQITPGWLKQVMQPSMILCNFGLKNMELEIETAKESVKLYREVPDYFNERLPEMYRAMIQSVN